MKKALLALLITLFISSCSLNKDTVTDTDTNQDNSWITQSWNIINWVTKEKELSEEEIRKQKIERIRKKLTLRWLIIKWDINLKHDDYTLALVNYLKVIKQIPDDKQTLEKIAEVYFNMWKYKNSYEYYNRIKDYDKLNKDNAAESIIFSKKIYSWSIDNILSEINTLWLNEEELFYYRDSVKCSIDINNCLINFENYFKEVSDRTWSWEINEIQFDKLKSIENALKTYNNFQIEDNYYKNTLVAWSFFENWLYPVAIDVSKQILSEKNDYKPLLKILAKSYYEMWNYIESKLALIEYKKIDKNDPEVSYFLWVVYEKLHEYVLSTIHLKKALENWYSNKLEVEKRILFNYYELWEIEKMLEVFKNIVNNYPDEINEDDYSLAIYYHILNNEIEEAKKISKKALEKFPESYTFNWYMWWILTEEIKNKNNNLNVSDIISVEHKNEAKKIEIETLDLKFKKAEEYIDKALLINPKDPMLNLVKWKINFYKWDYSKSFIYFKKTISIDTSSGDFWKIAEEMLDKIELKK